MKYLFIKQLFKKDRQQKGFVALVTVLIMSTVIVVLSMGMQLGARNTLSSADVLRDYLQSQYAVDACAEIGLLHVRNSDTTSGSGSETVNDADCSYSIVSAGTESFGMNIVGNKNNTYYEVDVTVDALFPAVNITSWEQQ
jgi:hypothetical protein